MLWKAWRRRRWEQDLNRYERIDYALARIAAEVRRSWISEPGTVDENSFLIKLVEKEPESKVSDTPISEEERQARLAYAKARWMSVAGILKKVVKGKLVQRQEAEDNV